jgi:hypothetical protein
MNAAATLLSAGDGDGSCMPVEGWQRHQRRCCWAVVPLLLVRLQLAYLMVETAVVTAIVSVVRGAGIRFAVSQRLHCQLLLQPLYTHHEPVHHKGLVRKLSVDRLRQAEMCMRHGLLHQGCSRTFGAARNHRLQ